MNSLKLDGAKLDMAGRPFKYDVPAPFGPKNGPAVIKIIAKPATAQNSAFKAAVEEVAIQAQVRDLESKRMLERGQFDDYARRSREDVKWGRRKRFEILYEFCVISWESTIQNDGKDIEPTAENFVALATFENSDLADIFVKIEADVLHTENFREAAKEIEEELEKN